MPVYRLKTPLSTEEVAKLHVGDTVYVNGVVVAALCSPQLLGASQAPQAIV
jgi:tartrate dehydratase beta subunit/fumarate hydratase class I family protein